MFDTPRSPMTPHDVQAYATRGVTWVVAARHDGTDEQLERYLGEHDFWRLTDDYRIWLIACHAHGSFGRDWLVDRLHSGLWIAESYGELDEAINAATEWALEDKLRVAS